MPALFDLLSAKYTSAAKCAAALQISRQAYSQAVKRRRLSDRAAMRAADLIGIEKGRALLINSTDDTPAPIRNTTQNQTTQNQHTTNYTKDSGPKKTGHNAGDMTRIHSLITPEQQTALNIIKWCFAVADMPADSPRFAYYVSRWRVPEKIAHAQSTGRFNDLIANCPPIDPAWLRHVPAALDAYNEFIKPRQPTNRQPSLSAPAPPARKPKRRVA